MRGAAAWGTASAVSILKCSSGMRRLSYLNASLLEAGEEVIDFLPHFRPAGKPMPVHADEPYQPIALIHRDNVVLRRGAYAVDQKGFNVRFHGFERGMRSGDLLPRFKSEQRFDGPCRAGIHSPHSVCRAVVIKEGQVDGNHE